MKSLEPNAHFRKYKKKNLKKVLYLLNIPAIKSYHLALVSKVATKKA